MPIGWQLIVRRRDDSVLAPTVIEQRAFAACVTRIARGHALLAFDAPGGHSHMPGLFDRAEAGRLARALLVGLGRVLGQAGDFEPVRLRPINDQAHARSLFRYALNQPQRHALSPDPLRESSALPDLMGLRVTGRWMRLVVAQRLPEVQRHHLAELLGVEPRDLDDSNIRCLADAAAASIARPSLCGRTQDVVAARAAAIQLARRDFRTRSIADALGVSSRTVQVFTQVDVDPYLLKAVQDQWHLRSWMSGRSAQAL